MADEKSGFDALLDALKQSGVNMDGRFDDDSGSSSGGSGSGSRGGSSGFGGGSRGRSSGGSSSGGSSSGGDDKPPYADVQMTIADRVSGWGKRAWIILIVIIVALALVCYWWFHPPINIQSSDFWIFVTIFVLLPLALFFFFKSSGYRRGTSKVKENEKKAKRYRRLLWIPAGVIILLIVGLLIGQPFFPGNAERFSSILETETDDFAEDIQQVNYSEVPIIDRASAELLGNREMGSIPDYVSQFEIDDTYGQINYHGEPVRVSVLGYADLFKWFANREEGIPAYSMVNMTTQDAEIVRLGEHAMFYSPSEPLGRNIERYVQLSYPFYMFEEFSFEIDEDGNPWWICPVQSRTIGLFDGETITRVVMCNATTGECEDLSLDEVPEWVDRVYPAELLIQQYNWYGSYHNGWLNSWLGQSGVVQTTPGEDGNLGYSYIAKDDDVWVYTGVTSATADSSIVGFVLVNQRTQEAHYYQVSGATEASAMASAEGQVQNLRYESTFPILINVADQPTYFMALKDNAGLVKKFAMIDIQRYQNVAVGDTVAETQSTYQALLATNGVLTAEEATETGATETIEGVIALSTEAVVDGNSHFYLMLDGNDTIFDFALPGLISIIHYQVGDSIEFTYMEGEPTATVQSIIGEDSGNLLVIESSDDEAEEAAEEGDAA